MHVPSKLLPHQVDKKLSIVLLMPYVFRSSKALAIKPYDTVREFRRQSCLQRRHLDSLSPPDVNENRSFQRLQGKQKKGTKPKIAINNLLRKNPKGSGQNQNFRKDHRVFSRTGRASTSWYRNQGSS